MQEKQLFHFGPYTFDPDNAQLRRGKRVLPVTRKACEVLQCLVAQPGHLVTKDALFAAVWPETVVSEGVLTNCIGELRRVLGDTTSKRRYIETVSGRGYRFLSPVTAAPWQGSEAGEQEPVSASPTEAERGPAHTVLPPPAAPRAQTPVLVGREAELLRLHQLLTKARQGERQIVFVTGEAGIGKTALLDTFLQSLVARVEPQDVARERQGGERASVCVAHGQCIEHYGAGEAYLPILEALGRLGRQADGGDVLVVLRRLAPTWLVQLPVLLEEADYAALQLKVAGATRERMLREMVEALEALSAERVLVLVLEDVHWSDASTIDLLNVLARRREPARILVIATYRPAEVLLQEHPLKQVKQDLVTRGQGVEVVVGRLPAPEVQRYVQQRWAVATELAAVVYRRTEGHPLFMVHMTEYLRQHTAAETLDATALGTVEHLLPQQLWDLLELQLGRLTTEERATLEAASVVGAEFPVASVAAAGLVSEEGVETICEHLVQQGQFLVERELATWPDGTVSGCYGFRHALYQEVLYRRLSASRRVRLHRQIGARMEVAYGKRAQEIAAELAMHFERGHDMPRAVHYLYHAGRRAWERCAYQEARTHLTAGMRLLPSLPDSAAQQQHELRLQMALALVGQRAQGAARAEVVAAFTRAFELAQRTGATVSAFEALFGLWVYTWARGDLALAHQQGEQLLAMAQQEPTAPFAFHAHLALGGTLYSMGELVSAHTHLRHALAADISDLGRFETSFLQSFRVFVPSYLAFTLWFLGYPEQARVRMQEAIALAYDLGSPYSIAITLTRSVWLQQFLRAPQTAYEQSQEVLRWSTSQGFPQWVAIGQMLQSWARSSLNAAVEEIMPMRQALATLQAAGVRLGMPYYLSLLAEVYLHARHGQEGLAVVADAFAMMEETGDRIDAAELWRLRGELLLQVGAEREAAECFLKAIDIAQQQQAKALELRAVISLVRLRHQQMTQPADRTALAAAHTMLAQVYGWFTEGFDTHDLQEARTLLESSSH